MHMYDKMNKHPPPLILLQGLDPESGGSDKRREKRGVFPVPLNSRAVGHL